MMPDGRPTGSARTGSARTGSAGTGSAGTDGFAVALLGEPRLAADLAARLRVLVTATSEVDHLDAAASLADQAGLVVGLSGVPWPTAESLHAEASATVPAYTGVVSWHALPSLHQRLADAVAPGVGRGAHLLITAPDPGPDTDPSDVLFLREIAEGISERVQPMSRSVAWRGDTRTPTAVDALTSVVEAHGRTDVIECPVAPGMTSDPVLTAAADRLGARLTCVDVGGGTRLDLLVEVVRTVAGHEGVV